MASPAVKLSDEERQANLAYEELRGTPVLSAAPEAPASGSPAAPSQGGAPPEVISDEDRQGEIAIRVLSGEPEDAVLQDLEERQRGGGLTLRRAVDLAAQHGMEGAIRGAPPVFVGDAGTVAANAAMEIPRRALGVEPGAFAGLAGPYPLPSETIIGGLQGVERGLGIQIPEPPQTKEEQIIAMTAEGAGGGIGGAGGAAALRPMFEAAKPVLRGLGGAAERQLQRWGSALTGAGSARGGVSPFTREAVLGGAGGFAAGTTYAATEGLPPEFRIPLVMGAGLVGAMAPATSVSVLDAASHGALRDALAAGEHGSMRALRGESPFAAAKKDYGARRQAVQDRTNTLAAAQEVQGSVGDPAAVETTMAIRGGQAREAAPGVEPSAPELAGSLGLKTLEDRLYRRMPEAADDLRVLRTSNVGKVLERWREVAPGGAELADGEGARRATRKYRLQVDEALDTIRAEVDGVRQQGLDEASGLEARAVASANEQASRAGATAESLESGATDALASVRAGAEGHGLPVALPGSFSRGGREAFEAGRKAFKAAERQLEAQVDPEGIATVKPTHAIQTADEIVRTTTQAEQTEIPTLIRKLAKVRDADGLILDPTEAPVFEALQRSNLPYREMQGVRRQLGRLIDGLEGNRQKGFTRAMYVKLKEGVDRSLDTASDPTVRARHTDWIRFYREGAETLYDGAMGRVLRPGRRQPVAAEDTFRQFFKADGERGAGESMVEFGRFVDYARAQATAAQSKLLPAVAGQAPDPEVQAWTHIADQAEGAMAHHILSEAQRAATPRGQELPDPTVLARWRNTHQQALAGFRGGELNETLDNVLRAQRAFQEAGIAAEAATKGAAKLVSTAETEANRTLRAAQTEGGARIREAEIRAQALERRRQAELEQTSVWRLTDGDPSGAVDRIMRAPDPEAAMRDLVGRGDMTSVEGLKAAVWERAGRDFIGQELDVVGNPQVTFDGPKVRRFVAENRKMLSALYSQEEIGRMLELADVASRVGGRQPGVTGNIAAREIERGASPGVSLFSVPTTIPTKYGIAGRVLRFATDAVNSVRHDTPDMGMNHILLQALKDDDLMKTLLMNVTENNQREWVRRLYSGLAPLMTNDGIQNLSRLIDSEGRNQAAPTGVQ